MKCRSRDNPPYFYQFDCMNLLFILLLLSNTMTGRVVSSTAKTTTATTGATATSESAIQHDEITIQLAKKESAHHLHGIDELRSIIQQTKPLKIKAYALDDPMAPSIHSNKDSSNIPNNNDKNNDKIVKIVHFVRHGQGFHNLLADIYLAQGKEWTQFQIEDDNPYVRMELLDAPLTDKGRKQAQALQSQIEAFGSTKTNNIYEDEVDTLEMVLLSTNCRALQTGVIAFQSYVNKIPFIAHEMVREEIGVHKCDQRRSISSHKIEFPMVNFDLIDSDEDELFTPTRRESKVEVGERVYKFLEWLENRDEKHIGITSHSGWLFTLFNGVVDCDDKLKEWFYTGEMRSVKLVFSRPSSSSSTTCEV